MSPDPADRSGLAPPLDPREIELARMGVGPPAILLILNGLLGLLFLGLLARPLVFDPEGMLDWFKQVAEQQPPGPEKQDLEQKIADFENILKTDRDGYVLQNAIILGVRAVFDVVAILGGWCMRRLSRYGLGMTGAVVSLLPLATGCCVTGIPFGIWALIVLSRPDIKAAFVAVRAAAATADPDAPYVR
jgi:hypothetical protein